MAKRKLAPEKTSTPKSAKVAARRQRIALAHVAGETAVAIAQAEGISRGWVGQELRSADTQALIATLVDQQADFIREAFGEAVHALRDALSARKEYSTPSGIEEGGPDHFARMTAASKLTDLLKAGRPQPKPAEAQGFRPLTIQEIEAALQAARDTKQLG